MSVYGDGNDNVSENDSTEPKSFYGVGKLASEKYLKMVGKDVLTTSLRLFNVYGPGQNMENMRQGMVSIFLQQAFSSNQITVKGSLDRFRDFIYIEDVVDGFLAAANRESGGPRIYNIGTGVKTTVKELLKVINSNFQEGKVVEEASSTNGDQFGIFANIDLVKKELGWTPKYSLVHGMKEMYNFYSR
jgi:UDP-glucose 4-epimerase